MQAEIGKHFGNLHLQGFIQFKSRKRFETVRKWFNNDKCRISRREKTVAVAAAYCRKNDTSVHPLLRFEKGNAIHRGDGTGSRTDIDVVIEAIHNGDDIWKIFCGSGPTFLKYHGGIKAACFARDEHLRREQLISLQTSSSQRQTFYYFGESGAGKTTAAKHRLDTAGGFYTLKKPGFGSRLWFTGYAGEPGLLIDEYGEGWIDWDTLMCLLNKDIMKQQVAIHGGLTPFLCTTICITGNIAPWRIHRKLPHRKEKIQSLPNRLTKIIEMQDYEETEVQWNNTFNEMDYTSNF